eukprot:2576524-Pleurochrysis_carterae.AAC.3
MNMIVPRVVNQIHWCRARSMQHRFYLCQSPRTRCKIQFKIASSSIAALRTTSALVLKDFADNISQGEDVDHLAPLVRHPYVVDSQLIERLQHVFKRVVHLERDGERRVRVGAPVHLLRKLERRQLVKRAREVAVLADDRPDVARRDVGKQPVVGVHHRHR